METKFRILYVDTELVWRGGQQQLFTLMTGIRDRGHRTFLAAPPQAPLSQKCQQLGIRTFPFHQRGELNPWAFSRLYGILSGKHFEVLHLNTPRPVLAAGLLARMHGVQARICARRVNFPLRSRLSARKYNWFQDRVVTVSSSIRQTLVEAGVWPERVDVIHEGVDLETLDRLKPVVLTGIDGKLSVGMVAHMSPEKGHQTFLEAASEASSRFPEVRFVLVGSGELLEKLKERARQLGLQERVIFTGFRPDSDALMKGFDIFCLPSFSEGLSSAILAAMANRLPVIATQVGGNPELVVDGKTGLLVPPRDPKSLSKALCQLLESSQLRRTLGEAARDRVQENFTLERKIDKTERLYQEILG